MKPLAIIPVYNEADILVWTLEHLQEQGCDIHVIDNHSTDGSDEIAQWAGVGFERWPDAPLSVYDWTGILKRIECVSEQYPGRWIIYQDADEIRRAPGGLTLAAALEAVEISGSNAVEYDVVTYVPTDNGYRGDPERYFTKATTERIDSKNRQVKTWIQPHLRVDLQTHGGHQSVFDGRRIYHEKFLLKHYPIRTQEQGERKLFRDRFPRFKAEERARKWHVQYDGIKQGDSLILQ